MDIRKNVSAVGDVLDRLRGLKFQITPEEHQLLGITPEDVQSFSDPELEVTPQEMQAAIQEIVTSAYQSVPAFKKIVTEDQRQGPGRFGQSSRLVSKFLKHLRGAVPPDRAAWIHPDTFPQAHTMVEQALQGAVPQAAAVEEKKYPPLEPLKDEDLQLFGLSRGQLTPGVQWADIVGPIQFFLGRKKDEQGHAIKNEATSKMPAEARQQYLFRLLREIRDLKIAQRGALKPFEERWLGRGLPQLEQIVTALVNRAPAKEPAVKGDDIYEIMSGAEAMLTVTERLLATLKKKDLRESLVRVGDMIDTSLPTASLVEDRVRAIQAAADELGLNKEQLSLLLSIDPATMAYTPGFSQSQIETTQHELAGIKKDIDSIDTESAALRGRLGLSEEQFSKLLKRDDTQLAQVPGITAEQMAVVKKEAVGIKKARDEAQRRTELLEKSRGIGRRLSAMEELATRDTTRISQAISDYVDTLSTYKDIVDRQLSESMQDTIPDMGTLLNFTGELSRQFNRLRQQEVFQRKWRGHGSRLFRAPGKEVPEGTPTAPATKKMASPDISGYAKKLEGFKGGGVREIMDRLIDFADDTEEGLEFLRDKLLSIMEVRPDSPLNTSPGRRDFTDNPLGGEGVDLDEMNKKLEGIRAIVKKLDLNKKKDEATEILQYLADLPSHIKASAGGKKNKKETRQASLSSYICGIASRLILGATAPATPGPGSGFAPGTSPKPGQYRAPSKGGWIIFRDRLTATGKKTLESFFKDTPFIADFVEQMEARGLNEMLRKGGEVEALPVDPVIEKILQDASGTQGSLDNILGTVVMQKMRAEYDIKKKTKDMTEAAARLHDLNNKIEDTDRKYLPILNQFAEFLADPLGGVRRQLEERRAPERAPGTPDLSKKPVTERRPIEVDRGNYQVALKSMLGKYHRGVTEKTAASSELPTDEFRRIHGVQQRLQDMKKAIESEKDSTERARKVREYLETSLESLRAAQDYLNGYRASLNADRATIENIKGYLASEEAKRDPGAEGARAQLKTLQGNFDHEDHIFNYLTDMVKKAEDRVAEKKTVEYLQKLTRDLSDNKVEQLYSVAVAPEMSPSKEEAQEIKERAREHEEGIGFIIDRDTYKKNMNRILTRHMDRGPASAYKGEGVSAVLPSERGEAYKKLVEDAQGREEQTNKIMDEQNRLFQQQALYQGLVDIYEKMKTEAGSIDEKVKDLKQIAENLKHLEVKKEGLSESQVGRDTATLLSKLEGYGVKRENLDKVIPEEERSVEEFKRRLSDLNKKVGGYHIRLRDIKEQLSKTKTPLPPMTPQKMRDQLMQLKVEREAIKTRAGLTNAQRINLWQDIDNKIKGISSNLGIPFDTSLSDAERAKYQQEVKRIEQQAPVQKESAVGDEGEPKTQFEIAEIAKSFKTKPPAFMKDLPKPKGWDILENFFDESRKELAYLENLRKKGKDWDEQTSQSYISRMDELEKIIPAIDAYKKQIVQIGPEAVPLRDVVVRFEDLMQKYETTMRKHLNQREDAQDRWAALQGDVEVLQSMTDPETGEFKGFMPEEIKNLRDIFFRELYRRLDEYWASKVGKNINVFGERDTAWYDNVYRTFKNLGQSRSNKKLMTLLNKYKEVTQSEFPKDMSRRLNRIQALEARRDSIYRGLKDQGVDPDNSPEYKELNTRINNLMSQKNQIDKVFNNMSGVVQASIHDKVEADIGDKLTGSKPSSKADLEKKVDEGVKDTTSILEAEIPKVLESEKDIAEAERMILDTENKTGIKAPATEGTPKTAYDRSHRDFDLKVLYGSIMQKTIADLIARV